MNTPHAEAEPQRAEIDALQGATLLEFGSPWCGHCRRAGVKLWPTLVFLKNGKEAARLVRPRHAGAIGAALAKISDPR